MRLARLAAVGLAIGVIAGFAVALLRPHPSTKTSTASSPVPGPDSTEVDLGSSRRVTG